MSKSQGVSTEERKDISPARGDERLALSGRLHEFADMAISLRQELMDGGWDEHGAQALVMTWFEHDSTYKHQA